MRVANYDHNSKYPMKTSNDLWFTVFAKLLSNYHIHTCYHLKNAIEKLPNVQPHLYENGFNQLLNKLNHRIP